VFIFVVIDEILGTGCSTEFQTSTVLIGHHISMTKTLSNFKDDTFNNSSISLGPNQHADADSLGELNHFIELRIQVYAKRRETIVSLLGQASVLVPTTGDSHEVLQVCTCRPISRNGTSEAMYRLKDYYLGSTLKEIKRSFSRFNTKDKHVVTEPSGTIHLRVQTISNNSFSPAFVKPNGNDEEPAILKESVDEVLSKMRRSKRVRALDGESGIIPYQQSGLERVALSTTTKDLLDRVRTARASRMTIG